MSAEPIADGVSEIRAELARVEHECVGTGSCADKLTRDEKVALAASLEEGIKHAKIREYVALAVAKKLDLPLPAWIRVKADYFTANNDQPVGEVEK